ncbi:response regulator [Xylophilus sp. ASV27]|uniref:response regulator n=1 Tax=Xylophilus sp. ASV27 TaxID=2795129 RepID=UPI001E5BBE43|nr:response regulator transcription factor [Xylophilus sp. ASV27]
MRVLLVDDHPLVRDGVRMRLGAMPDVEVVGDAGGLGEALEQAQATRPDIVVTDIRMPEASGLHLAEAFRTRFPAIRLLVLSMHRDPEYIRRAVSLGVWGYVLKDEPGQQLVEALCRVHRGEAYFSPPVLRMLEDMPAPDHAPRALTPREADVLALLARGHSNKDIARALGASVRTVETHRLHLRRKLHIEGQAALVKYAVDHPDLAHAPQGDMPFGQA